MDIWSLLATGIGEPLFRFAESDPIPVPDKESKPDEYFMFEIGEVTSISTETDSLVFKLDLTKEKCSPMDIAMACESILTVDSDLLSLADESFERGENLVGFGAQRRGALGLVTETSASSPGIFSFKAILESSMPPRAQVQQMVAIVEVSSFP